MNKPVEVLRLFSEVKKIFMQNLRKSFESFGLTIPQSLVVRTLLMHGDMKMSDLGTHLNLSNSTISGIIDRLEKQEFVSRSRSQEDRRVVYVSITPKFDQIHKDMHTKSQASIEELLSHGTEAEVDKIIEGLNILKELLAKNVNER